jgi:hypothetical protein
MVLVYLSRIIADSVQCDGTFMINKTKNTCTGTITENKISCSLLTGINNKPKVCGNGKYGLSCYDSCISGEELVKCSDGIYYTKYLCNSNGLGYTWSQSLNNCPTGTTCQNKVCQ